MSGISNAKHVVLAALALLLCSAGLELGGIDFRLQSLLFDAARQQWIWSGAEPITRLLLYDGPKRVLLVALTGLALSLLLHRFLPYMPRYARGIRILFLSLILVPASVSGLKAATNVACPKALTDFGGAVTYVGILERYPPDARPAARQECFPAAHASGGFALLALFFLFGSPRNRRRAIYVGLGAGWVMGGYKIAIGDHFLSHTVVSMLWAWLVINLIVIGDDRLHRDDAGAQRLSTRLRMRAALSGLRLSSRRLGSIRTWPRSSAAGRTQFPPGQARKLAASPRDAKVMPVASLRGGGKFFRNAEASRLSLMRPGASHGPAWCRSALIPDANQTLLGGGGN